MLESYLIRKSVQLSSTVASGIPSMYQIQRTQQAFLDNVKQDLSGLFVVAAEAPRRSCRFHLGFWCPRDVGLLDAARGNQSKDQTDEGWDSTVAEPMSWASATDATDANLSYPSPPSASFSDDGLDTFDLAASKLTLLDPSSPEGTSLLATMSAKGAEQEDGREQTESDGDDGTKGIDLNETSRRDFSASSEFNSMPKTLRKSYSHNDRKNFLANTYSDRHCDKKVRYNGLVSTADKRRLEERVARLVAREALQV